MIADKVEQLLGRIQWTGETGQAAIASMLNLHFLNQMVDRRVLPAFINVHLPEWLQL